MASVHTLVINELEETKTLSPFTEASGNMKSAIDLLDGIKATAMVFLNYGAKRVSQRNRPPCSTFRDANTATAQLRGYIGFR